MTIYPERSRSTGKFTGLWIAETTSGGVKRRERCLTFEDAEETEARLKGDPAPVRKPDVLTLGELARISEGKLWAGRKNEIQSARRWYEAIKILGRQTPVASIRLPQLEAYVDRLRERRLKAPTINRYLASVSRGLRWAFKSDLIPSMPPIPWQHQGKGRIAWLPEDMTEPFLRLLAQWNAEYAFVAETLLITGMRLGEFQSLEPNEVQNDVIYLSKTKTDSPRAIPLPEGYGDILKVFVSTQRTSWFYRNVLEATKRASEALGIFPRITPHVLRHTAATRLVRAGVNALTVAELLGHRSLATTRQYAHHEVSTLRSAMVTLKKGSRVAMALEGKKGLERDGEKTMAYGYSQAPVSFCSPLRSHSATRPQSSVDKHLSKGHPTVKR